MNGIIDVKELPDSRLLVLRKDARPRLVSDYRSYCYSVNEPGAGEAVSVVTKKVLWHRKPVRSFRVEFPTWREMRSAIGRNLSPPLFEFDLRHVHKYCLDMVDGVPPESLRAAVYDIETDPERGQEFILGAVVRGTLTAQGFVKDGEPEAFDDPKTLIKILQTSHAVVGHNIYGFDNRIMTRHGLPTVEQWLRNPQFEHETSAILARDMLNIDTLYLAARFLARAPSLSLKRLSEFLELGRAKYVSPAMMEKIGRKELAEYCCNDVTLTAALLNYFTPQFFTAWKVLRMPASAYMAFPGKGALDTTATLFARTFPNFYIPAKEKNSAWEGEHANPNAMKLMGHYVIGAKTAKPDETGFQGKILGKLGFLDYRSLYPSIILKRRISPETVVEARAGEGEGDAILVSNTTGETMTLRWKTKRDDGFLIKVIEDLNSATAKYREMAKKDRNFTGAYVTIKGIFRNAQTHGIMTFKARPSPSRFINILGGAAITTEGRRVIEIGMEIIKSQGGQVVYANTDGVFFIHDNPDLVREKTFEATHYELDLEIYDQGYFASGKNYALVAQDGGLIVKGATMTGKDKPRVSVDAAHDAVKGMFKLGRADAGEMALAVRKKLAEENNLMAFAVHVPNRIVSKAAHLKEITEMFKQKWGIRPGMSFDAVITGKEADGTIKPWATRRGAGAVTPLEFFDKHLRTEWYEEVAHSILRNFTGVDLKQAAIESFVRPWAERAWRCS